MSKIYIIEQSQEKCCAYDTVGVVALKNRDQAKELCELLNKDRNYLDPEYYFCEYKVGTITEGFADVCADRDQGSKITLIENYLKGA